MRQRIAAVVIVVLWAALAVKCAENVSAATIADLVERTSESVVYIEGDKGSGSGFVLKTTPHVEICTNHHVMKGSKTYTICFFMKSRGGKIEKIAVKGRAYFAFERLDFGIIRLLNDDPVLKKIRSRIKALPRGNSRKIRVGERVFLIGSPGAGIVTLGNSVSEGIISGTNRHIRGIPYFQTTAPVNFGNSGGPLLNMKGQVVGIVTSKSLYTENIGFALPIHITNDYGFWTPEKLTAKAIERMKAGDRFHDKKKYDEALKEYSAARKLEPNKVRPIISQASTLAASGKGDQAVRLYNTAINCKNIKYDDLMFCVLEIGKIHGRANKVEKAIRAFEFGLARDPTHSALNRNIGVSYANSGRKSKALAHWYISLSVEPNQPKLKKSFMKLLRE